ncbi:hypothetical protein PCE1_000245 [Barthelona sp. PCE]
MEDTSFSYDPAAKLALCGDFVGIATFAQSFAILYLPEYRIIKNFELPNGFDCSDVCTDEERFFFIAGGHYLMKIDTETMEMESLETDNNQEAFEGNIEGCFCNEEYVGVFTDNSVFLLTHETLEIHRHYYDITFDTITCVKIDTYLMVGSGDGTIALIDISKRQLDSDDVPIATTIACGYPVEDINILDSDGLFGVLTGCRKCLFFNFYDGNLIEKVDSFKHDMSIIAGIVYIDDVMRVILADTEGRMIMWTEDEVIPFPEVEEEFYIRSYIVYDSFLLLGDDKGRVHKWCLESLTLVDTTEPLINK